MPLISGHVVDEQGQPVAWARVMFARGPVPMPDVASMTGEDGRFTLSVPANGPYEILIVSDEHGKKKTTVAVTGDRHDIAVRLGR